MALTLKLLGAIKSLVTIHQQWFNKSQPSFIRTKSLALSVTYTHAQDSAPIHLGLTIFNMSLRILASCFAYLCVRTILSMTRSLGILAYLYRLPRQNFSSSISIYQPTKPPHLPSTLLLTFSSSSTIYSNTKTKYQHSPITTAIT